MHRDILDVRTPPRPPLPARDYLHVSTRATGPTGADVLQAVSSVSGVQVLALKGPARAASIARPRMLAAALMRRHCPHLSAPGIGRQIGNRDHTTILHAIKRWSDLAEVNPELRMLQDRAEALLLGREDRA